MATRTYDTSRRSIPAHVRRFSVRDRTDLDSVDALFRSFLRFGDLDAAVRQNPAIVTAFERDLADAIESAFVDEDPTAHLLLQRILYRINRMKLFWYDDLSRYDNERSEYLRSVRTRIEDAWQTWESRQLDVLALSQSEVREALALRAAEDLLPAPSVSGAYFRNNCALAGYRRLLEIFSLDALVEASQLSRTLGGISNDVHMVMTKLLLEEYGNGKTDRKHSSYFGSMLVELGMSAAPEEYFDSVPWEVLATINHSFLLSERKRFYLRYAGGLLYTEISTPAAFENFQAAAERLGFHRGALNYWQLHIREDERHGRWMLENVALPLAERYPDNAWELVLGYDQQRRMSARAGAATARAAQEAGASARATHPLEVDRSRTA